ncbi:MAG: diheme cytochrome c-553 [Bacteroidota bacterium]
MSKSYYLLILLFCSFFIYNCTSDSKSNENDKTIVKTETKQDLITRGAYLSSITGCDHCHTPKIMTDKGPVPDMDRWMMGHPENEAIPTINKSEIAPGKWTLFLPSLTAAVGPWGVSYAANITPDDTGIGTWTYEQFKSQLQKVNIKAWIVENQLCLLCHGKDIKI